MPSERVQRQIDRLLDEAEAALTRREWPRVHDLSQDVLALDPENADARSFLDAAIRAGAGAQSRRLIPARCSGTAGGGTAARILRRRALRRAPLPRRGRAQARVPGARRAAEARCRGRGHQDRRARRAGALAREPRSAGDGAARRPSEHRHHPRRRRGQEHRRAEPAVHRQPVHVGRRRRYARDAAADRAHARDREGRLPRTRARAQARRRAPRPQARQRLARRRRHGRDRRLRPRRRVRAVATDDARHARRHGGVHAAGAGAWSAKSRRAPTSTRSAACCTS